MRKNGSLSMLLLGALALPGCGSVPDVILDAVQSAARESLEQALDEAVDGVVGDLLDFGPLTNDDE